MDNVEILTLRNYRQLVNETPDDGFTFSIDIERHLTDDDAINIGRILTQYNFRYEIQRYCQRLGEWDENELDRIPQKEMVEALFNLRSVDSLLSDPQFVEICLDKGIDGLEDVEIPTKLNGKLIAPMNVDTAIQTINLQSDVSGGTLTLGNFNRLASYLMEDELDDFLNGVGKIDKYEVESKISAPYEISEQLSILLSVAGSNSIENAYKIFLIKQRMLKSNLQCTVYQAINQIKTSAEYEQVKDVLSVIMNSISDNEVTGAYNDLLFSFGNDGDIPWED